MKTKIILALLVLVAVGGVTWLSLGVQQQSADPAPPAITYLPCKYLDTSGFSFVAFKLVKAWNPDSLDDVRESFLNVGRRNLGALDVEFASGSLSARIKNRLHKATVYFYEGQSPEAYEVLKEARTLAESTPASSAEWLYSIIYYQGVAGLRRGEDENCLMCRGDGACIFPIRPHAVHANPTGSRLAVHHFAEYLKQFPNDLGARWLLNLAYMTLGEHPTLVPPEHLLTFENFGSGMDIGRFRDIGNQLGVDRFNFGGGAIMDDFDNDGLLDLVVSTWDVTSSMSFYRNFGNGKFEDRTEQAKLGKQYGGLYCVQTDYNNDGLLDIFIPRGAWLRYPIRPSLLRNNGDGTFTDVTVEAGLAEPVNSITSTWADYDNDGFLDLFICCEKGLNRLYRNKGDGTFEEVAARAGVQGGGQVGKGAAWIDFDNDDYPDLYVNFFEGVPQLFRNNRDGTFTDVTVPMGILGPTVGFSCWAWDYDNDGWLDILATSYYRELGDVVRGMLGKPPVYAEATTRLYRNLNGKMFEDVSKKTGVDKVFTTMGSNFGDFDNDGYLDFYLGTGSPDLGALVPNRMLKNVGGSHFVDITVTSGTGHLQKGHGVACGDWDRDGNVDIFIELGGASPGDRFRNAMFQNPGQGNNWITLKLIGKKTNRAAIGARIKVVTAGGEKPLTVHRHVSSGSSFGANPLQQTIGLAKAKTIDSLEIHWPTSKTTQIFRNVSINQAIEVTEFANNYRKLPWTRIPIPEIASSRNP